MKKIVFCILSCIVVCLQASAPDSQGNPSTPDSQGNERRASGAIRSKSPPKINPIGSVRWVKRIKSKKWFQALEIQLNKTDKEPQYWYGECPDGKWRFKKNDKEVSERDLARSIMSRLNSIQAAAAEQMPDGAKAAGGVCRPVDSFHYTMRWDILPGDTLLIQEARHIR